MLVTTRPARERFAGMPRHLRDRPARLVPALRLPVEVLVEPPDVFGRTPDRALRAMLDALLQDSVGWRPDGVEVARNLERPFQIGQRKGGIGAEKFSISRSEQRRKTGSSTALQPFALWTFPGRRAQRSSIPNWLNRNSEWQQAHPEYPFHAVPACSPCAGLRDLSMSSTMRFSPVRSTKRLNDRPPGSLRSPVPRS